MIVPVGEESTDIVLLGCGMAATFEPCPIDQ
jgi:hypothetical protein